MKRIVPHDPNWAAPYASEAKLMADFIGDAAVDLHHMGSTSIPNLQSKPIIDVIAEASSLSAIDSCAEGLARMGYEARGEYGLSGRSYFKKPPIGQMVGFHLRADIVGSYRVKGIWRFLVKP